MNVLPVLACLLFLLKSLQPGTLLCLPSIWLFLCSTVESTDCWKVYGGPSWMLRGTGMGSLSTLCMPSPASDHMGLGVAHPALVFGNQEIVGSQGKQAMWYPVTSFRGRH